METNSLSAEVWKEVTGSDGLYSVSNFGSVRSNRHNRVIKFSPNAHGYHSVSVMKWGKFKNVRVHRLVAEAFIPNPNEYDQVNHINGVKTDNRAENLEWCNAAINVRHAFNDGLARYTRRGSASPTSKLNEQKVLEIISRINNGDTDEDIAKHYGVSKRTITFIRTGESWAWLTGIECVHRSGKTKRQLNKVIDDLESKLQESRGRIRQLEQQLKESDPTEAGILQGKLWAAEDRIRELEQQLSAIQSPEK